MARAFCPHFDMPCGTTVCRTDPQSLSQWRRLDRVRITGGGHAFRQAVRREHDVFVGTRPFRAHLLGECLDEQRVVVKRPHARKLDALWQDGCRGVDVFLDAQRRKLRRHGNAHDAPGSDPFDLAYRVGDERSPIAHPHDNGNVEAIGGKLRPKRVTLLARDVGQRRSAADRFLVVGHFLGSALPTARARREPAGGNRPSDRRTPACHEPSTVPPRLAQRQTCANL